VLPFLLTTGTAAIVFCIGLSAFALGAIGVVTALFNGRGAWFSAARQIVIGCAAAGVTYGVGTLLGVSLS
jgi:VIT1/CCC1 family predicted Fe2+/Mn2+ transporter